VALAPETEGFILFGVAVSKTFGATVAAVVAGTASFCGSALSSGCF
jgi:hypothetical protein